MEDREPVAGAVGPANSPAELRDLAELAGLLTEIAGLVHDLGALIVSLMRAATEVGDGRVRTFTIPPELVELAEAHRELKAEQQALNARLGCVEGHRDRVALRRRLAELTERATQAVSAAASVATLRQVKVPDTAATGATRQSRSVALVNKEGDWRAVNNWRDARPTACRQEGRARGGQAARPGCRRT
ncbi:MAG: hypothetical protein ACRDNS_00920 [Trebonia sp.]